MIGLFTAVLVASPALAGHYEASLEGSFFEIDDDANLRVDSASGFDDWASVEETRRVDLDTGQSDDSFKGGVKEDTACPTETTGSIPNNKSDLKTFGVYQEPGAGSHPGYLHIYWSRVQDPSGTTLMDFEFNQSTTPCEEGSRFPLRTAGDFLVEYAIDQGGARANVTIREWEGTAWGAAQDLDDVGAAVGTINQTAIPEGESDIGALDARTFGEASVDLSVIFDSGACQSFGSATLKSRSSDSFTSQLKDFIAPQPITLTNCGSLLVEKVEDGTSTRIDGAEFTVTPGQTDALGNTAASSVMTEYATGLFCIENLLLGVEYTVTETVVPDGYIGADPQQFTVTDTTSCATRVAEADTPDLTFENQPLGDLLVQKFIDVDADGVNGSGDIDSSGDDSLGDLSDWEFSLFNSDDDPSTDPPVATGTTDEEGQVLFEDLIPGDYVVVETNTGMVIGTYSVESYITTPNPSAAATVTTGGSTTVEVGNACFIEKEFEVTGVPAGTTGLYAWYDTDLTDDATFPDNDPADDVIVNLAQEGATSTWSAFASETFVIGDSLVWGYGVGDDREDVDTETFGVGDSYPDCRRTNSTDFEANTINAAKYKDANDDGSLDAGDIQFEGWNITLTGPGLPAEGITQATDVNGEVSFTGLAPGTYTLTEETRDGWIPTNPSDGTHEVTVGIGESSVQAVFLNTPESELRVGFTDLTGSSDVNIVCKDHEGTTIASLSYDSSTEVGEDFDLSDDTIRIGDSIVTCTFEITDP